MKCKLTTETGSVYEIDPKVQIAVKNGIHALKYGVLLATPDWDPSEVRAQGPINFAWETGQSRIPLEGECLYISGFGGWYLSTPITKVEEL